MKTQHPKVRGGYYDLVSRAITVVSWVQLVGNYTIGEMSN